MTSRNMQCRAARWAMALSLAAAPLTAWAESPTPGPDSNIDPAQQATIADKAKQPAAQVSADAQSVLRQVRDSYQQATALQMEGTWKADLDVNGQKVQQDAAFTSAFEAPNRFKHESKDDLIFGSTGEKLYAYLPARNGYLTEKAPAQRAASSELPNQFGQILREKNPALLVAMTTDATPLVTDGVTKVDKVDDVKIDEKSYTALQFSTERGGDMRVLVDPDTHLIRQFSIDMKKALETSGQQNVNKAELLVDYKSVKSGDQAKGSEFAWAPPQGAKDLSAGAPAAAGGDDPAAALVGKPAPAFTLEGMDGKKVSTKDLKGSVAILDFWATWCPPCRAGLPHLDKLYQEKKEKGLKAYAVNLKEEKNEVKGFVDETKLTVPVLLDVEGSVAEKYKVSGIPQTVVLDKNGNVAAVIVGFGGEDDHRLAEAVEKAMK